VFVRTGGCDYRCNWCDSLHAVDPVHRAEWVPMTVDEILDRVGTLAEGVPTLITLSGGNPALHPAMAALISKAHDDGDIVAMETQGSVAPRWMRTLDHLIISPKPPSAGFIDPPYDQRAPERLHALGDCIDRGPSDRTALKVVVFDEHDFQFANYIWCEYASRTVPLYLSVGNADVSPNRPRGALALELLDRYRWLVERVLTAHMNDVIVLPQLHVLAWGNARGV
jgi:7-carboxy-7-deazaguanine synthase